MNEYSFISKGEIMFITEILLFVVFSLVAFAGFCAVVGMFVKE